MKRLISFIPNTITLLNLLCGCMATYAAFEGLLTHAFWLIIAAAVFDFMDGFAARMLKAYSPMGKELDSLADMVSFGFAPAAILFSMVQSYAPASNHSYALVAFVVALFSALRLAKFNIDERQTDSFIGLPTPACAMFFASLPYGIDRLGASVLTSEVMVVVLLALGVLFSALLVSEIPMFSFKFKTFGFRNNAVRYLFAIFSVIMIMLLSEAALSVIIVCYMLISMALAVGCSKCQKK